MRKLLFLLVIIVTAAAVWAGFHFGGLKWQRPWSFTPNVQNNTLSDSWSVAVEKVKADRGEPMGTSAVTEIPDELKHYSDRHWFLATQVAEVAKYSVPTTQDFLDLSAMIQRGEMVMLPSVTDTYVVYGVGQQADDKPFRRYMGGGASDDVELYNESELKEAYKQLEEKRSTLQKEIADLKTQSSALKKREREKRSELQKQISERQQELNSNNQEKARLDQFYGRPENRQRLFRDYQSLDAVAKNFRGHSYNISYPADRQAMKINMLRSLRPEALKILEAVAKSYHDQFDRPLPVSSLVRPEEYQHALRRVNRNAVLIDTPPHSTGLAFDIDYRYMSAAEQTFVMTELARLENEGRIEAIRERNANYHVFAFIKGFRPSDELIAASLDEAGKEPVQQAHHASKSRSDAAKAKKSQPKARSKARNSSTGKSRVRRRR